MKKVDEILAQYFRWKAEDITEINKTAIQAVIAQELDQALTKISFYHAIPKKELEKTIKEKL